MSSANSPLTNKQELIIPTAAGGLAAVLYTPAERGYDYTVIFCHGFRGSKEGGGRALALAAQVAGQGFATLLFDFTPLAMLSNQVAELRAVVDYCRRAVSRRVILFGRSMGGSAALIVAAADQDIAGVCLWSTPHELHETFRLSLGEGYDRLIAGDALHIADEFGELNLTADFLHDFDRHAILDCVERLNGRPLLVVHGEQDEIVPRRQAAEIFSRATEPKKMAIIAGGDHRFLNGHKEASAAVLAWLETAFPLRQA